MLGFGALFAGFLQVPGVDHVITTFLEGTFESSTLYAQEPSTADSWIGLLVGGTISIIGIAFAYHCYVRRPGITVRMAERYRRLHTFLFNKWYFDEAIDFLIYRPVDRDRPVLQRGLRALRRPGDRQRDDGRGEGRRLGGPWRPVGLVRAYALLLIGGFAALASTSWW